MSTCVTAVTLACQHDCQRDCVRATTRACASIRACVCLHESESVCLCTSVHGRDTQETVHACMSASSVTFPVRPTTAQGGQGVQPGDTVTSLLLCMPIVAGDSENKCAPHPPWAGHTQLHTHPEAGGCACTSRGPPSSVLPKRSTESHAATGPGIEQGQSTNTQGSNLCFRCL